MIATESNGGDMWPYAVILLVPIGFLIPMVIGWRRRGGSYKPVVAAFGWTDFGAERPPEDLPTFTGGLFVNAMAVSAPLGRLRVSPDAVYLDSDFGPAWDVRVRVPRAHVDHVVIVKRAVAYQCRFESADPLLEHVLFTMPGRRQGEHLAEVLRATGWPIIRRDVTSSHRSSR